MKESKVSIFVCPECGYITNRVPDRKQHEKECWGVKMNHKTLIEKRYSKFVTLEIEGNLLIDVFI